MNDYERRLFNGKCPYNEWLCSLKIPCNECKLNEEERHLYDEENGEVMDELKQQLFELSFALDSQSAGKDYIALRRTHYDNIQWLHDHGLQEEYYQFWVEKLKEEKE